MHTSLPCSSGSCLQSAGAAAPKAALTICRALHMARAARKVAGPPCSSSNGRATQAANNCHNYRYLTHDTLPGPWAARPTHQGQHGNPTQGVAAHHAPAGANSTPGALARRAALCRPLDRSKAHNARRHEAQSAFETLQPNCCQNQWCLRCDINHCARAHTRCCCAARRGAKRRLCASPGAEKCSSAAAAAGGRAPFRSNAKAARARLFAIRRRATGGGAAACGPARRGGHARRPAARALAPQAVTATCRRTPTARSGFLFRVPAALFCSSPHTHTSRDGPRPRRGAGAAPRARAERAFRAPRGGAACSV